MKLYYMPHIYGSQENSFEQRHLLSESQAQMNEC